MKRHILFGSHLFPPILFFCFRLPLHIWSSCPILLWPVKVSDFLRFGDLESLEEYWYFAEFSRSSLTYLLPSALPHSPFLLIPVSLPLYFLGKRQRASFCLWPCLLGNCGWLSYSRLQVFEIPAENLSCLSYPHLTGRSQTPIFRSCNLVISCQNPSWPVSCCFLRTFHQKKNQNWQISQGEKGCQRLGSEFRVSSSRRSCF